MPAGLVIRKNQYYDSVFLMRVAQDLSGAPGVGEAVVVMATDANKQLLTGLGFASPELAAAGPNDLAAGVISDDPAVVERLLGELDARLQSSPRPDQSASYRSYEEAAAAYPQANLVVITVPGEYAGREARKALEGGRHVFLFSDNVPLEEEVELKQIARAVDRLLMGPGCGTSLLGGIGVGFANRVRRGSIGAVGASGTGLQEFTSLVHQAGGGISHAIGTGSRDLADAVGGVTTLMALDILEADPATRVIALVSKPSGGRTLAALQERLRRCAKPVVGCLLGLQTPLDGGPNYIQAATIDEAVRQAIISSGQTPPAALLNRPAVALLELEKETHGWLPEQRYLRGLFSGGTLCYQAQQVLMAGGIPAYSNSPIDPRYQLKNPDTSLAHSLLDLGDETFTRGLPHPMIDARERSRRIIKEADDQETAILLLDFVLGDAAAPDPAGDLAEAIASAKAAVARRGGRLSILGSICGTDLDPQGLGKQRSILQAAGVTLLPSSAQAAGYCLELLKFRGVG